MEIDGDLIGKYGFSCGVANARVFLDRKFPYVRGQSVLKTRLLPHVQAYSNFGEVPFLVRIYHALDDYLRCSQ